MIFLNFFISVTRRATDFKFSQKKDLWTLISKQVSVEPQPSGSGDIPNPGFAKFPASAGFFQMLITLLFLAFLHSFFETR